MRRRFVANRPAVIGLVLWVGIAGCAVLGPMTFPGDPFEMVGSVMTAPNAKHLLGTDYLGRDVLAGIVHGAWATLVVGLCATLFTLTIGVLFGALGGFYGGAVDNTVVRVTEFFQVVPGLLLAMVLITLLSPSLVIIVVAVGVVNWTQMMRLTRAEFLKLKESEFVIAEVALGASTARIIWRIILPNSLSPLIVAAALNVGVAILFEAMLSFLGLGDPNVMSWGYMIGASRDHIWDSWWAVTFPGLAIFVTVLSVSLIGDGLSDAFNVKLRGV